MFTGIITHKSKVISISDQHSRISIENLLGNLEVGTSVSVDGACLTVSSIDESTISFDISAETIEKTIIKNYIINTEVNLELPVKNDTLLSGHIVLGHIDTVGTITKVEHIDINCWNYYFNVSDSTLIVDKGSIAINGISLTTNTSDDNSFYVSIIKETFDKTNLSKNNTTDNSLVNIEYDIIGKYVYKFAK